MARRFKAIVLLLTLMVSHAQVVIPGAIMRTIPAAAPGGGITFEDQNSHITLETGGTDTLSLTLGSTLSNGYIVVGVGLYDGADKAVSSVTFDGVTMDQLAVDSRDFFGEIRVYVFGLAVGSKAMGSYNVVATLSGGGGVDQFVMGAASYNGVHQTTSTNAAGGISADGESTAPTITVTSATGELVVACYSYSSETITTGAGETIRWDEDDLTNHAATYVDEDGAASVVISATLGSSTAWLVGGISLVPAP